MRIIPLVLLSLFITTLQAQKTNLQLNLKIGQTYSQVQTSVLLISQTINGQSGQTKLTISGKTNYYVKAVKDTVYTIDMSFERLDLKMETAQGAQEFSSDGMPTDPVSEMMKSLTNKPVSARLSNRGRILEAKTDSLIDMLANQHTEFNEQQKLQLKQQLKQSYGEKSFKTSFEMLSAVYPDIPVSIGDKWKIKSTLESTVLLDLDADYSLISIDDNGFQIHGETKMTPQDNTKETSINGMPVVYDLSGTMESDIRLDRKSGWITKADISQTISGTAKIKDNPEVPGGMDIPMSLKTNTTVTDK